MLDHIDIGSRLHARYWDGEFYAAVVVAVSESKRRAKAPVKVSYLGYGSESDAWLPVADLKSKSLLPRAEDSSAQAESPAKQVALLEKGAKLQAKAADGVWYAAQYLGKSRDARKKGCALKVNFLGYTKDSDEWVTLDCIRSKLLKLQQSRTEEGSTTKRGPAKKHSKSAKLSKPDHLSGAGDLSEVPINLSGAVVCSVSVSPDTLVREVKEQIFAKLGIPVACQVLVADPVALMDDDATLGDLSAVPSMEVVEVQESGESVMSRLQNLLQHYVDTGEMRYSRNKGEVSHKPELTFFNIDLLEDAADECVMGVGWGDGNSDDHKNFAPASGLGENDLRMWFPQGDLPDFAADALHLLNEQGKNGSGCFTFSKPDPWGLEGYVVGMGAVIRSGCVVGWEQNGVTWA